MWIIQKFYEGGLPFMLFLLLLNVGIIVLFIKSIIDSRSISNYHSKFNRDLNVIIQLGLFALFSGIFIQVIALYQVLTILEKVGDISPPILMGGLKVSMNTTIYGGGIFAFAAIVWFVMKYFVVRKEE